jgi:hypothetical protein
MEIAVCVCRATVVSSSLVFGGDTCRIYVGQRNLDPLELYQLRLLLMHAETLYNLYATTLCIARIRP